MSQASRRKKADFTFFTTTVLIYRLPEDLALLPSLKSLTLDGNPLRGIRLDILQRGTGELLKYLRTKVTKVSHEDHSDGGSFFFDRSSPGSNASSTTTSPRGASNPSNLSLDPHKLKDADVEREQSCH